MNRIERLLKQNALWAEACATEDPGFFKNLADLQQPTYLWIGCSDARVPANTIVGLKPGEVFVHRNVGNLVVPSDLNCQSVLQYAIEFLKVRDVIVCGHYGCGGVQAVMENRQMGMIDLWLKNIKEVSEQHADELNAIPSMPDRMRRLCELNVMRQVKNVCATSFIQQAWQQGNDLMVHGFIYDVRDGLLKDLHVSRSV